MQIDVGQLIASLLYEHETVSISGLGGLVKEAKPTTIDQVQGIINPPAHTVTFNENLAIDDGLIVGLLQEKYQLSYGEAKRALDQYVQQIQEALQRKEIVVFPEVGRLYSDYEKKLQFIPDATNFNLETFGLPPVQFYPVVKHTAPPATSEPKVIPVESDGSGSQWLRRNWPLLAVLLVLLVTSGGFLLYYPNFFSGTTEEDPTIDLPSDRLNVKPNIGDKDEETATLPGRDSGMTDNSDPAATDDFDASATEESTPAPGQQVCVIAIGVFRNKENIDRLSRQIISEGYVPYLENNGARTKIGIQFAYESEGDIQKVLKIAREKFEKNAFVMKR